MKYRLCKKIIPVHLTKAKQNTAKSIYFLYSHREVVEETLPPRRSLQEVVDPPLERGFDRLPLLQDVSRLPDALGVHHRGHQASWKRRVAMRSLRGRFYLWLLLLPCSVVVFLCDRGSRVVEMLRRLVFVFFILLLVR